MWPVEYRPIGIGRSFGQWLLPRLSLPPASALVAATHLVRGSLASFHSQYLLSPAERLCQAIASELHPRNFTRALLILTEERMRGRMIRLVPHRVWLATARDGTEDHLSGMQTEEVW